MGTEGVTFSEFSAPAAPRGPPLQASGSGGFAPINTVPGLVGSVANQNAGGGNEWPALGNAWSHSTPNSIESDTETGTLSSAWGCPDPGGLAKVGRSSRAQFGREVSGWVEDADFQ